VTLATDTAGGAASAFTSDGRDPEQEDSIIATSGNIRTAGMERKQHLPTQQEKRNLADVR
jgi:hypothetical protein